MYVREREREGEKGKEEKGKSDKAVRVHQGWNRSDDRQENQD